MIKATKFFLLSMVMLSLSLQATTSSPFSKIIITSNKALCKKHPQNPGFFVFQYQDNVHVTFADQSTVTADLLEVIFDSQEKKGSVGQQKKPDNKLVTKDVSYFKNITFKNNVRITNLNRTAVTDCASFNMHDQTCILEGNVKIWQKKQKKCDVPIQMSSQKARLDLVSGQLNFLGTSEAPVSTTIVLEGHPSLQRKTKDDKKKHHAKNSPSPPPRSP